MLTLPFANHMMNAVFPYVWHNLMHSIICHFHSSSRVKHLFFFSGFVIFHLASYNSNCRGKSQNSFLDSAAILSTYTVGTWIRWMLRCSPVVPICYNCCNRICYGNVTNPGHQSSYTVWLIPCPS